VEENEGAYKDPTKPYTLDVKETFSTKTYSCSLVSMQTWTFGQPAISEVANKSSVMHFRIFRPCK
jgi:hypothetical protein